MRRFVTWIFLSVIIFSGLIYNSISRPEVMPQEIVLSDSDANTLLYLLFYVLVVVGAAVLGMSFPKKRYKIGGGYKHTPHIIRS